MRQQNSKEMFYKCCQEKGPNENLLIARFQYLGIVWGSKMVVDLFYKFCGVLYVYVIREEK